MAKQRVVVLAGGVGGGKFACGVRRLAQRDDFDVTVIVNTGDDMWLTGLRVCPDLDSVMYALGGANDTKQGWGRANESQRVSTELAAYGVGWPWFTLGDLDVGTHLARTTMLRDGLTLTDTTRRLCERWNLGVTVLPVTDAEVPTLVDVEVDGKRDRIHFEEWWVKHRAAVQTYGFVQQDVAKARVTAAADAAIRNADTVLIAPSNPIVSIGTMLGIPGATDALAAARGPVIGVSPVINGAAVRGMADVCCQVAGIETSARGIAEHYGARDTGGVLDGWIVDSIDAQDVDSIEAMGIRCAAVPLWMTDDDVTAEIAAAALEMNRRPGHTTHTVDKAPSDSILTPTRHQAAPTHFLDTGRDQQPFGYQPEVATTEATVAAARELLVFPLTSIPEITAEMDLGVVIGTAAAADPHGVQDGDVFAVTSKILSKAENRTAPAEDRDQVIAEETVRIVAERTTASGKSTRIVENQLGVVGAAAGVDASNTAKGTVLRLPAAPDASAHRIRMALQDRFGVQLGVVITDTLGRPWRRGQTDIVIGSSGVRVLVDLAGTVDAEGRLLGVTAPAVGDEIAGAADLVKGKSTGHPVAVIRGIGHLLDDHAPGGRSLQYSAEQDWFRRGSDEAYRDGYAAGLTQARANDVKVTHPSTETGADY